MSWMEISLGDIAEFRNGLNYTKENDGEGLRVINVKDFGDKSLPNYDELGELNPHGILRDEALLQHGDIIFVRSNGNKDLVGRSLFIDNPPENVSFSAFCIRARLDESENPYFYAYFFRTPNFRKRLALLGKGTNISNLNQQVLNNIKVPKPSVVEKVRIVDLLRPYDDLIENNRRRIQLLEQAARLLYKEWFVHLRFPGHDRLAGEPIGTAESRPAGVSAKDGTNQHVKIKDGVPEGWEKRSIGELAPFKYGKALKKDDRIPGPYPVYGSSGIVGAHDKALVTGPAIIVGRKGNVGSVYWSKSDFYPIDTVYYIEPEHCSLYLYYALLHTEFISTDVAVPGLNRNYAHSRTLLVPDYKIQNLFEQHAGIMHDQIQRLTKYNQFLTKARDHLLPRLMNGSIPIS